MRRARAALLIAPVLVACGPAGDDDDPRLNADHVGVLRQAATCPNGGSVEPPPRSFGATIDAYAGYEAQTRCDPTAKPGVIAFRDLILATYPCTTSGGIGRDCSIGGTSEHKEGRAWDWMINVGHPAADALLNWLLATDAQGRPHALARRVGIMYMVWNRQIWSAYRVNEGWRSYTGSNPHTDHVHFSFSWAGANKQTSYWSGTSGCTPKCEGSKIVDKNCGVGDCGAFGSRCVDDALGVRCVFYICPDTGSATVCVNGTTLGRCKDGQLEQTDCTAQGAVSCAWSATREASCVSPECAGPSGQVTRNQDVCLADGRIARCNAGGQLQDQRACPADQPCALYEGIASCGAPPVITGEDGVGEGTIPGGGRVPGPADENWVEGGCSAAGGGPGAALPLLPWLALLLGWRRLGRLSRNVASRAVVARQPATARRCCSNGSRGWGTRTPAA